MVLSSDHTGSLFCTVRLHGLILQEIRHYTKSSCILIMVREVKMGKELTTCYYFEMKESSRDKLRTSSLVFCIKAHLKYNLLYEIVTGTLRFLILPETWILICVGNGKAAVGSAVERQVVCCKTKREFWRTIWVWSSTAMGLYKRCAGSGRIKETETERETSCEQHCLSFVLQKLFQKMWKNIINT